MALETHGRWPLAGAAALARDPDVSRRALRVGIVGGVAVSAALVVAMRWRVQRRRAR
jgi:hypothetical protein